MANGISFIGRVKPDSSAGILGHVFDARIELAGHKFDGDDVEYWRSCLSEFCDTSEIYTEDEYKTLLKAEDEEWGFRKGYNP